MTMAMFIARHLGHGSSRLRRVGMVGRFLATAGRSVQQVMESHCQSASDLAARLELGDDVRAPLVQAFERWDGKGVPGRVGRTELAMAIRLVHLADAIEAFHHTGGVDAAVEVARTRRGTQFDPELVDSFCADPGPILDGLGSFRAWDQVIDLDPRLGQRLTPAQLDAALLALADFSDLKCPSRVGHSRGVAELVGAAGATIGMTGRRGGEPPAGGRDPRRRHGRDHQRRLEHHGAVDARAAGAGADASVPHRPHVRPRRRARTRRRVRVTAPRAARRERIPARRLRERALDAGAPARGRRRVPRTARAPPPPTGVGREHRRAGPCRTRSAPDGSTATRSPQCCAPRATGCATAPRCPAGLTRREVEVLVLLVRGCSNPTIAAELTISRKTVSSHLEHIYAKLGVSTRTEAALFAMHQGLVEPLES